MPLHRPETEIAKPETRGEACDEFDFVLLTLMRIWNDDDFPTSAQKLADESRKRLEPIYSVLCSGKEEQRKRGRWVRKTVKAVEGPPPINWEARRKGDEMRKAMGWKDGVPPEYQHLPRDKEGYPYDPDEV